MLFLDGVYVVGVHGTVERFRWVKAPTTTELTELPHTIAERVGRCDEANSELSETDMNSVSYYGNGVNRGNESGELGKPR